VENGRNSREAKGYIEWGKYGWVSYSLLEPSTAMLDEVLLRGMLTEWKAETAVELCNEVSRGNRV